MEFVTLSERCSCRTLLSSLSTPEEARQRRGQALDLGDLVDGGCLHSQRGGWDYPGGRQRQLQQDPASFVAPTLGFSAFMVVGALVVAHRPSNAISWIFSAIALLAFTGQLASEYATYALVTRPGSLPGAILAAWYNSWPWYLVLALARLFTPYLTPPAARSRPVGGRPAGWPGQRRRH